MKGFPASYFFELAIGQIRPLKKTPPPGHPWGPKHNPTVGSYQEAFSHGRGTPVADALARVGELSRRMSFISPFQW